MPLFYRFSTSITDCFRRSNLAWHVLAISLTYVFVVSGFDWLYYRETRNAILDSVLFPAIIVGGLLPMVGPLILLLVGKVRKSAALESIAWALWQAALIGWSISAFYKAFTGRAHPVLAGIADDVTGIFHFGFLRGGIFWGWPSSHTTVAFAMAFALAALYPKNNAVRYFSFAYALYIGAGVSVSIHWFSDFVAGAIIGAVVGTVVGKSFLKRNNGSVL